MKKLLILLALLLVGYVVSAKQRVEYYRYNLFEIKMWCNKPNKETE